MIKFITGNIFDSDAEAIVNSVNCVGIMGRGLALQFKKNYPDNFNAYEKACTRNEVVPGKMFIHELNQLTNPKYIINFPTKRHWRGASRIEDIETGLIDLAEVISQLQISTIALPPIGAGLGGLDWNTVRERISTTLGQLSNVDIIVYEPNGTPSADLMVKNRPVPKMTPGRAALVSLASCYIRGLLDPFLTLLELHKLMYLLQESGEPLRLRYVKAPHGPYAENLSHVINAIEGHLLSGYADGGDNPAKQISLVPGAEEEARAFLANRPDTMERINRVTKLINGFETPFGMELLATVHWVATREANTLPEITEQTYKWGAQKQMFSPRQIIIAAQRLAEKDWIRIS